MSLSTNTNRCQQYTSAVTLISDINAGNRLWSVFDNIVRPTIGRLPYDSFELSFCNEYSLNSMIF